MVTVTAVAPLFPPPDFITHKGRKGDGFSLLDCRLWTSMFTHTLTLKLADASVTLWLMFESFFLTGSQLSGGDVMERSGLWEEWWVHQRVNTSVYLHSNSVYICAQGARVCSFFMCIISWQGRIYFAALFLKDFKAPLQRPVVSDTPVCNGIIWLDGIETVIWEDSNQHCGSNTEIVKRVNHLGFLSNIPQKHVQTHTKPTEKQEDVFSASCRWLRHIITFIFFSLNKQAKSVILFFFQIPQSSDLCVCVCGCVALVWIVRPMCFRCFMNPCIMTANRRIVVWSGSNPAWLSELSVSLSDHVSSSAPFHLESHRARF